MYLSAYRNSAEFEDVLQHEMKRTNYTNCPFNPERFANAIAIIVIGDGDN